jgi:hypothetical protein
MVLPLCALLVATKYRDKFADAQAIVHVGYIGLFAVVSELALPLLEAHRCSIADAPFLLVSEWFAMYFEE